MRPAIPGLPTAPAEAIAQPPLARARDRLSAANSLLHRPALPHRRAPGADAAGESPCGVAPPRRVGGNGCPGAVTARDGSRRKGLPPVRRWAALVFGVLMLGMLGRPVAAQNVFERLEDAPLPNEVETRQIGGSGFGVNMSVGSLRCGPADAVMVGARTRKGSVVDYLQIACARYQNGRWGQRYWRSSAGNAEGGAQTRVAFCPEGWAIAGVMALATEGGRYLQDLRFECARVAGWRTADPGNSRLARPVFILNQRERRQWAGWQSQGASIHSYQQGGQFNYAIGGAAASDDLGLAGRTRPIVQSRCLESVATGLSVAEGTWLVGGNPWGGTRVVQAFSMFCWGEVENHQPATRRQ